MKISSSRRFWSFQRHLERKEDAAHNQKAKDEMFKANGFQQILVAVMRLDMFCSPLESGAQSTLYRMGTLPIYIGQILHWCPKAAFKPYIPPDLFFAL